MFKAVSLEMLLLSVVLVQGLFLLGQKNGFLQKLFFPVSYLLYAGFVGFSLLTWQAPEARFLWSSFEDGVPFRIFKIAALISAIFLVRMVSRSQELLENQKHELCLLFSLNLLLCLCALDATTFTLAGFAVCGVALLSTLLVAFSRASRQEAEGAFKSWHFSAVAIVLLLLTSILITLTTGDGSWEHLRTWAQNNEQLSFGLFFLLFVPTLIAAALFPFHFYGIDRNHAASFVVQTHLTVHVQGVLCLALCRWAMKVFYSPESDSEIFSILATLGLAGAMWGALGAFSQVKVKRYLAYLSLSAWSLLLVSLVNPGADSLGSIVLHGTVLSLGMTLLFFCLQSLGVFAPHSELGDAWERSGSSDILLYLILACVAVFAFMPVAAQNSFFLLLRSVAGSQSVLWVVLFLVCWAAQLLSSHALWRGITRQALLLDKEPVRSITLGFSDRLLLAFMGVLFLSLTVMWDGVSTTLLSAAQTFIISP